MLFTLREPITMCNKYFWTSHRYEIHVRRKQRQRPKRERERERQSKNDSVQWWCSTTWPPFDVRCGILRFFSHSVSIRFCNAIRFDSWVFSNRKAAIGIYVERTRKLYIFDDVDHHRHHHWVPVHAVADCERAEQQRDRDRERLSAIT